MCEQWSFGSINDPISPSQFVAPFGQFQGSVNALNWALLGQTLGCARCHDHKIDPIAQQDYYSLLSFFSDISPHGSGKANLLPVSTARDKALLDEKIRDKKKREQQLAARIAALEKEFVSRTIFLTSFNPSAVTFLSSGVDR